ncbi:MAG TPA: glycosyltransferase family 4 protein, partial [Pyrinomonadaceae bacterium]
RYGINVDRFPETSRIPHRGFRVVSIGNLDPVKGFDILIRAAAIVAAQRPDVEFEIIGEDRSRSRRNERELRRLISEMEPSTKVVLSGWSDKIPEKLPNFDVFVSTSRTESFGAAIAEAMLCGVPVIATETEGAKEIISDPSLGRLVPVDSPRSLAAEIIELIDNEQTRAQLALNGRAHILANFSFDRMVDETERLYRRIVPPDR